MKIQLISFLILLCLGCNNKSLSDNFDEEVVIKSDTITLSSELKKYVKISDTHLTLDNVSLIDGTGTSVKRNQRIIIYKGQFQSIGDKTEIPLLENTRVIDLKNKTLIPGIIGVHNHLHIPRFPFIGNEAAKLYLAAGVTTIQTCGSASPEAEIELAMAIDDGQKIGPKIITSGPYFDGKGGNSNMIIPRNEQQIIDTIEYWTNKGVNWFKVYRHTTPTDLEIIVREAHKRNAKVTGHLCATTFEEAANIGIDGIEHGFNSMSDFRTNKSTGECGGSLDFLKTLSISDPRLIELQKLLIENHIYLVSTLAIYESSMPNRSFADQRTLGILSPYLIDQYNKRRSNFDSLEEGFDTKEDILSKRMEFEYQFFKLGGNLTAGVDPGRHVLPGFGDQRNFELLLEAGFSIVEAIKIMTHNGAKALSNPSVGSIEVGKNADFIVLENTIIEHLRDIELVFKNGLGYDPDLILTDMKGKFGLTN